LTHTTPYLSEHSGFSRYLDIAKLSQTPVYVYDSSLIISRYQSLLKAFSHSKQNISIRYAIKANSNQAILKIIHKLGGGAEVVSEGELFRALKAGIDPQKIIFSGVGKTEEEITFAIQTGIEQLSVESLEELLLIKKIASFLNKRVPICLRLNPNIEANTHKKITTGTENNKFGISLDQLEGAVSIAATDQNLDFLGFSVHIGSQVEDVLAYRSVFQTLKSLVIRFRAAGHSIRRLDLGGGFFVPYTLSMTPQFDFMLYATAIQEKLGDLDCDLVIEPGRYLVAESGILLTKVLYIKSTSVRTFVVVDAGMNDMMRTALYDVEHPVVSCHDRDTDQMIADVVGPVCESSDCFAAGVLLPKSLKAGDILAITHTGAYGTSLSSTYNSRPLIPEVLIDQGDLYLIREAISIDHLLGFETMRMLG